MLYGMHCLTCMYMYMYFMEHCSGGKLALSLLSNTAFALGVTVISNWEEKQLGLQWNNLGEPLSIDEQLNMGAVIAMMICDIILYMLIAW